VVDEDSFGGPQLAEQAHRITRLGFAVCLEEAPDHQEHGQEDDGIEKRLVLGRTAVIDGSRGIDSQKRN